jgi:hypothetical protein
MAEYAREELVRAVLHELGALDANSAPEAADFTKVDTTCQQKMEALYEDGLIPFDLDGEIPGRYFRPLVQVIAPELLAAFGKMARAPMLRDGGIEGRKELCRLRDVGDEGLPTRAEYY